MKQEDTQLLFKELCARFPYHVIVTTIKDIDTDEDLGHGKYRQSKFTGYIISMSSYLVSIIDDSINKVGDTFISNIKPYLHPMKSMTEKDMDKLNQYISGDRFILEEGVISVDENFYQDGYLYSDHEDYANIIDWLNEHHFDYRGLIEKGLALEAPEGMYKED